MTRVLAACLLVLCVLLGLPGASTASNGKKVLIVSTNASVPRFRQVEDAFAASYPGPVSRLDLGPESDADARVRTALLAEKPDAVFCVGSRAYLATAQATQRAPIVFSAAINWRRLPSADNVFGVASELPPDLQLTTFRQFFPRLQRIGIVYSERFNDEVVRAAVAAGGDVRIEVVPKVVHRAGEVVDAVRELLPRVDALWLLPDPVVLASEANARSLLELAQHARVPVLSYDDAFVEGGALLAMTSDQGTIGAQAALLVEDIVAGRRIEQRVVAPAGSQIVVNARLMEHYGLTISRDALSSVNRFAR